MPHELKLTQGALFFARQWLKQPGWAKGIDDIVVGGELLAHVLPKTKTAPQLIAPASTEQVSAYENAWEAWSTTEMPPVSLSEAQRDALKTALKHAVDNKQMGASVELFALLQAIGYAPHE